MCDYSLMGIPNRLAVEGESLVTYRFSTGSVGLAPPEAIRTARFSRSRPPEGFWNRLCAFFSAEQQRFIPAVCIPPGARLRFGSVSVKVRRHYRIEPNAQATFTQLTATPNQYRDALRFDDGKEILLQELDEGISVDVLSLEAAGPRKRVHEYIQYSLVH